MRSIFYGWWILAATSLIHFFGAGTFFYSFTAFFNPIVDEFGWSYAATAFAYSLRSMEGGIVSPLVGIAADKLGVRRLLLTGSIVCGLGFLLLSRIDSLVSFYLIFLLLSLGFSLLMPIPGWTVAAAWFSQKRGIAMGVLSGAVGIGGLLVYLVNALIGQFGWRTTLVLMGIGMWIVGIPCAWIVRDRPEAMGLRPDGAPPAAGADPRSPAPIRERDIAGHEFTLVQALRTGAFWGIAATSALSAISLNAVIVHVMPYLISIRFSRDAASMITSLLVLVSVVGRMGMGWLSIRVDTRYLIGFGMLIQGVGLLCLIRAQAIGYAILFLILFGPGYGGVITLRLTLIAEYFGDKAYGAIQGAVLAVTVLGTMASPVVTGMIYDRFGSYRPAWLGLAAILFLGIAVALGIRPPKGSPGAP